MRSITDVMDGLTDMIHKKVQGLSGVRIPITGVDPRTGATAQQVDPTGERGLNRPVGKWRSQGAASIVPSWSTNQRAFEVTGKSALTDQPSRDMIFPGDTMPARTASMAPTPVDKTPITTHSGQAAATPTKPVSSIEPMWTTGKGGEPLMQNLDASAAQVTPAGPAGTGTPVRNFVTSIGDQTEIRPNDRFGLQAASGGAPGGTLNIMGRTEADVEKSIAAQKQSGEAIDEMSFLAGAHGPEQYGGRARQVAERKALSAKASMMPWEIGKIQAETQELAARSKAYEEHAKYYAAQAIAKNPTATIEEVAQQAAEEAMSNAVNKNGATAEQATLLGQKIKEAVINMRSGKKLEEGTPEIKTGLFGGPNVPATSGGWKSAPAQEDLEHTAKQHNMSVDEVKKRLGL